MPEWKSRAWGLSLSTVSESPHSLEQNCSACSPSLPESRRLHPPCPSSWLRIASRRQRNSSPPFPGAPGLSRAALSPLLLGQRAASLQPDILSLLFLAALRGVSSLCHPAGSTGAPGPCSRCWGGRWHMGRGAEPCREAGLGAGQVLSPWDSGVCTLGCPSFLPGSLSAQMESAIRSFASFPKHTTHSLPV